VSEGLPTAVADGVIRIRDDMAEGTLAVITPRAHHGELVAAVKAVLPDGEVGADSDSLSSPVSVLTVLGAKGLEFDHVLIVEPSAIVAESRRGLNDLYVALTRPTQRLYVVHTRDLPPGFPSPGA
jgi:DNA helicase IV